MLFILFTPKGKKLYHLIPAVKEPAGRFYYKRPAMNKQLERNINLTGDNSRKDLLVLGIGNFLCGDDGIGPVLAERLMPSFNEDRHVDVINGGTIGLGLLYLLDNYTNILFLDAVDVGAKPGEVFKYSLEDLESVHSEKQLSSHQSDPCGLLRYAQAAGISPCNVTILGIQIEHLDNAIGLSETLLGKLPAIEAMILDEIKALIKECMK